MGSVPGLLRVALLVVLTAQIAPTWVAAETSPPKPTLSPPPNPPPASASPTPATASGTPAPTPTPGATPPGSVQFSPDEYAQALAVIQATSLLTRVEAEQQLTTAQRAFIDQRVSQLNKERDDLQARIAALQVEAADRQRKLDRIIQDQYRESQKTPLEVLLSTGSILNALLATNAIGSLADAQHTALREVQRVEADLQVQRTALRVHETEIASLSESLVAKDEALAKLRRQAEVLAGGGNSAEVTVLRDLVDQQLLAAAKVDQLVAQAAAAAGAPPLRQDARWVWPAKGVVSQEFGPTALDLEPPITYHGITFPHFHAALDIAAPLGTPVLAAQAGRVAFAGHLPDGAEVVLIAHDGGLFSLYAHLDDVHIPPTVKAGDLVRAGDPIGVIGLTGITTGAHLHFVIRRGDEPVDPRSLLPAS